MLRFHKIPLIWLSAALVLCNTARSLAHPIQNAEPALISAQAAFDAGDYAKSVQLLQSVLSINKGNSKAQFLLTRTYFEMRRYDDAIASGEKDVVMEPRNSESHEWLGRAYGEKADESGWLSALSLARKSQAEFETAVRLDEHNFSAFRALIEYDCTAPGIVGGGDDKAKAEIASLETLDAAEGHFARGICKRQKKDYAAADEEFTKALAIGTKSADLIYDIGDYAMKRQESDRLMAVAEAGHKAAPTDPRGDFYFAVGLILKKQRLPEAENLVRDYLKKAPQRSNYPPFHTARVWLGRCLEGEGKAGEARHEYEEVLRSDPKNREAREALKKLSQ
jgi:tetratricopeptide (TPR) repeat protein